MKRPRRNHGAAFKAPVAFAAVKGDKTLAELATQFSVHPTQLTEWKQHLLARAVDVFGGTDLPGQIRSRVNVRLARNQGGQGHAQETVYARGDYSTSADG